MRGSKPPTHPAASASSLSAHQNPAPLALCQRAKYFPYIISITICEKTTIIRVFADEETEAQRVDILTQVYTPIQ